jgi:hypothetical protein
VDCKKGFYSELKDRYYKYPAILPPLTWLSDEKPTPPDAIHVRRDGSELVLTWENRKKIVLFLIIQSIILRLISLILMKLNRYWLRA